MFVIVFSDVETAKKVFEKFDNFESIFKSLISDGIIAEDNGLYFCVTNQEGKPWDLL